MLHYLLPSYPPSCAAGFAKCFVFMGGRPPSTEGGQSTVMRGRGRGPGRKMGVGEGVIHLWEGT